MRLQSTVLATSVPLLALAVGCGAGGVRFERGAWGASGVSERAVAATIEDLFGTPDDPRLPHDLPALGELLDLDRLRQAAGPVISHTPGVTQGLYRRHCARCHGVTGDGRGPTALYQSPYPRDFRRGVFKWKSTFRDAPPTPDDLHATLERGVPGTAMPSFALLSRDERETLRQYVVYLAIRGQTERALVEFAESELPPETATLLRDDDLRGAFLAEWVRPIVDAWASAPARVVTPSGLSDRAATERVAEGRNLYHSERAGCAKCHGPEGRGGAVADADYEVGFDDWTAVPGSLLAKQLAGADYRSLPPRPATPREIVGSTLHGGTTTLDLWRRLHQGVAGTPMPAVGGLRPGDRGALTDDEVRSLAAYVETLLAPRPKIASPSAEVAAR